MSAEPHATRTLILGATSAVAGAAARHYAARGDRLHLVARSRNKLDALLANLQATDTQVPTPGTSARFTTACVDFLDPSGPGAAVAGALDALSGLDTVLIAHGLLGDQLRSEADFTEAERILRTNLVSTIALLIPIANHMEAARSGRIGVITSVAAERGRPRNYTYGAAKAALNVYLQGLRSRLFSASVSVTTIKLGPVDTPMTADHPKNFLFSKPDVVGRAIVAAIDRGVAEAYVPRYWRPIMALVRATPEVLFQRVRALSSR